MDRDYVVERYRTRDGKVPFEEWVAKMKRKDPELAFRILLRIDRAEKGNFGDYRYLREGIWELKIDCDPGYRIYFAVQHRKILLLLSGGDKKSQKTDVKLAIDYWKEHQRINRMSKSQRKFSSSVSHDEAVVKMLRENPSYAQLYLQVALDEIYEDQGIPAYLIALRRVIESRGGIGEIAAKAGLSRQQLYRTLSDNGNPTLTTLMKVTRAAGVKLFDSTVK